MRSDKIYLSLSTVVAFILIIAIGSTSGFTTSGQISLGFPCSVSFNMDASESLVLYTGTITETEVNIWAVQCGISNVRLSIEDIPEELYSVSPSRIASIAPNQTAVFTITFTIPEDYESIAYTGRYIVNTQQGIFTTSNIVEVDIPGPEPKPEARIPQGEEVSTGIEGEPEETTQELSFWWFISLVAVLVSITIVASDFFVKVSKEGEAQAALDEAGVVRKKSKKQ